jgi:hypothetical protein
MNEALALRHRTPGPRFGSLHRLTGQIMSAHCNDKLAINDPVRVPRSIQVNSGQFLGWGSAPGPSSAWAVHTLAMRRKCRCKAGLCRSPTNCMQCAAKRMHSRACFRKRSDLDTARLLGTPTLEHRTASRALSVAYATQKRRIFTGGTRTQRGGGCVRPLLIVVVFRAAARRWRVLYQALCLEHWS